MCPLPSTLPGLVKGYFRVVGIDEAHVIETKTTAAHVGTAWHGWHQDSICS
jgi:hypothetical protein